MSGRLEPNPRQARSPQLPSSFKCGVGCTPRRFGIRPRTVSRRSSHPTPTRQVHLHWQIHPRYAVTTSSVVPSFMWDCRGGERMGRQAEMRPARSPVLSRPHRLPASRRTGSVHDAGGTPVVVSPHVGCGEWGSALEMCCASLACSSDEVVVPGCLSVTFLSIGIVSA